MPRSTIVSSISYRHSMPSECDQQLHSDRDKISFSAIRLNVNEPAWFKVIDTSHNHYSSTLQQDDKTYTVPRVLERIFETGNLHMLLWELDDEIFTEELECWKGWYCIWYAPAIEKFYMTKLADDGLGYVDVPGLRDKDLNFWFRSEMADIRNQLVNTYGR